jgi:hypothetical protein
MANFSITNSTAIGAGNVQQNLSATYKTQILIGNSTATTATNGWAGNRRYRITDIIIGTNGTPADNAVEWDLCLVTLGTTPAGITGTLISSISSAFNLDSADVTFQGAVQINSTGEVGITAVTEKWYLGANQRASFRDVVNPGQDFVLPANSSGTGSNAFALRARSAGYTGTVACTIIGTEL